MAIYIDIEKIEENTNWVSYRYCANKLDSGVFSVDKNNLDKIFNVKLAKNDEKMKYLFRAFSAVKRDFNINNFFPDTTCYAA